MSIDAETIRVSELRQVTLHFVSGSRSTKIVLEREVPALVEASIKLHHTPGKNPATGGQTSRIYAITASRLEFSEPYWWSSPSLEKDSPDGAHILDAAGADEILFHDVNAFGLEPVPA